MIPLVKFATDFFAGSAEEDRVDEVTRSQVATAKYNAEWIKFKKEDLLERSEDATNQRERELRQMLGRQKAAAAASGIDIESGSVYDAEMTERMYATEDIQAIRNNTWRQALGMEVEAMESVWQAEENRWNQMQAIGDKIQAQAIGNFINIAGSSGGF